MAEGRLTINIISSDMPGQSLDSEPRYRRTVEFMHGLRSLLNGERLEIDGEFAQFDLDRSNRHRQPGLPADVFRWLLRGRQAVRCRSRRRVPHLADTVASVGETVADMRRRADAFGRN